MISDEAETGFFYENTVFQPLIKVKPGFFGIYVSKTKYN